MSQLLSLAASAGRIARAGFRAAALGVLLALAACGGGGADDAGPPAGGGNPAGATAPTIGTQPAAQSVTAPAQATFTVTASGSATLAYQWRSSSNGTDWADIAGATNASYTTGATDVGMNGRYYCVSITNSAGSVVSDAVRLTVQAAPSGGGGPSGEFPHAANPMAVSVTPGDAAITAFGITSSADGSVQAPAEATDIAVASGVTVSLAFPSNSFLEDQTLAVTPVTLAGLDAGHPLPFQSVIGAFDLAPADTAIPELAANNLVRVSFTLSQAALDGLAGGRVVMFSARSDGTQLRLVPVSPNEGGTWSALTLTTRADHLGIFGIASVSDAQALALAAAWPSFDDFQLQAALAPPSYELRRVLLAAQPGAQSVRARPLGSADADWVAQMKARVDAYYNDQVVPALNAANAASADMAQFRDATQKILTWERMRQLLGAADGLDADVMQQLGALMQRGLDKAKGDCAANQSAAAAVEVLGMLRQMTLLGFTPDTTEQSVLETCGRSSYDVSVTWAQTHVSDINVKFDGDVGHSYTGRQLLSSTLKGKLHLAGTTPQLSAVTLDYADSEERTCAVGAYLCTNEKTTVAVQGASVNATQCGSTGFFGSYRVDRWNLDARGRVAGPVLYVTFQNAFGCAGNSFSASTSQATKTSYAPDGSTTTATANAGESVDTAPWSGSASLGTSSRIVRRSSPLSGGFIVPGSAERWTTSVTFNIVEVKAAN